MPDPKTILVHVAPNGGDAAHIQAAAALARLFGARLVGVGAEAFRPDRDPRLTHLDGLQVAKIRNQIDAELDQAKAQFLHCAGEVPTVWATAYEDPDDLLVGHAACADLIVAAAAPPHRPNLRTFAEIDDLVFESGLPVLGFPADQTQIPGRHVVIGWKNTREARRAVGDALPFLKRAESVSLLAVCERKDAEVTRELDDVVARLAGHGVAAVAEPIVAPNKPAGEVLLQVAETRGADLVVAGARGRSRLHAWILGSVTRHLIAHARLPVLFSR